MPKDAERQRQAIEDVCSALVGGRTCGRPVPARPICGSSVRREYGHRGDTAGDEQAENTSGWSLTYFCAGQRHLWYDRAVADWLVACNGILVPRDREVSMIVTALVMVALARRRHLPPRGRSRGKCSTRRACRRLGSRCCSRGWKRGHRDDRCSRGRSRTTRGDPRSMFAPRRRPKSRFRSRTPHASGR